MIDCAVIESMIFYRIKQWSKSYKVTLVRESRNWLLILDEQKKGREGGSQKLCWTAELVVQPKHIWGNLKLLTDSKVKHESYSFSTWFVLSCRVFIKGRMLKSVMTNRFSQIHIKFRKNLPSSPLLLPPPPKYTT